jgi:hypothetical protein
VTEALIGISEFWRNSRIRLTSTPFITQVVNFIQTRAGVARSVQPAMRCEIDRRQKKPLRRRANHNDAIECLSQQDDVS